MGSVISVSSIQRLANPVQSMELGMGAYYLTKLILRGKDLRADLIKLAKTP
jgi:hypothetical protein